MDFAQPKRVYNSFTSKSRPSKDLSQRISENWNRPVLVLVNALKDHVFFTRRCLLTRKSNMSSGNTVFRSQCTRDVSWRMTSRFQHRFKMTIEGHPFRETYEAYKDANELPLVSGQ